MIYALPGMGADSGMYGGAWRELPEARFLDWPGYDGEASVAAVARRMVAEAGIADDSIVIGSSLGGIVGCEIARIRRLRRLVLIGSATHRNEISFLLSVLHPLVELAPIEFVQRAAGKVDSEVAGMFSRGDPSFIRAMGRAVFSWEGLDAGVDKPLRIHGRFDHVIPCPKSADLILDGGHLIALSHPEECVAFISAHRSG